MKEITIKLIDNLLDKGGHFKLERPRKFTTIDGDIINVCSLENITETIYETPKGKEAHIEVYALTDDFEAWCVDDLFNEQDIETLAKITSKNDLIAKYLDKDIYYVEETKHGKQLNIQRYYYNEEGLVCLEYTGVRIPIKGKITREQVNNETDACKQYTYACELEYVLEDMQNITELSITEVNENTPIGKYIDKY